MNYFLPALGLLFITLKLIGTIDWSWWLVLIPLYPLIIVYGIIFGILAIAGILFIAAAIEDWWCRR